MKNEAFTFTARQAEKYQAVGHFLLTHPETVPRQPGGSGEGGGGQPGSEQLQCKCMARYQHKRPM